MGNLVDTVGQNDAGMTQLLSTRNDDPDTTSDAALEGGPHDYASSALSGSVTAPGRRPSALPFQPSWPQTATSARQLPEPVETPLACAELPPKAIRSTQLEEATQVRTSSLQLQQQRPLEYAKQSERPPTFQVGHELPSFGPTELASSSTPPEAQDVLPATGLGGRTLIQVSPSRSPLLVPEEHFSVPESSSEEQHILPQPQNPVAVPPGLRRLEEGCDDGATPAVDAVVTGAGFWRLSMFARTLLVAGATVSLVTALLGVVTWKLFQEPLGYDVAYNASRHLRLLAPLARGSGDGDVADSNGSLAVGATGAAVATAFPPVAPLGVFEDAVPLI